MHLVCIQVRWVRFLHEAFVCVVSTAIPPTNNPKFCSRSCSVTTNNQLSPKRKGKSIKQHSCQACGVSFIPHYGAVGKVCSRSCYHKMIYIKWCEKVEATGKFTPTSNTSQSHHKHFLIDKFGYQCQICGRKTWLGNKIALVFDHIDGDSNNWCISNCRLICNNCDSLLPTYKGRNRGRGRSSRREIYREGQRVIRLRGVNV